MAVEQLNDDTGGLDPGTAAGAFVPEPTSEQGDETAAKREALLASVPEIEVPEPAPAEQTPSPAEGTPEADVPIAAVSAASGDAAESGTVAFPQAREALVSIWPFVVYDLVWLAFAGVVVWQLLQVPPGAAVYDSPIYPFTIIGGLVLTAMGPVLIVGAWLFERGRSEAASGQLLLSSLMRGSVATLLGVALWWTALITLDQLRLGRLF